MTEHDDVAAVLGGPQVEIRETHCSKVFLHTDDVFKIKKPVRFPFLDYSRLELRHDACEQELEVNRRAAPSVYRGLLAVVRNAEGRTVLQADPAEGDQVLEWVVHMKRLADDQRGDVRLAAGTLGVAEIDAVAKFLAEFQANLEPVKAERGAASLDALRTNVLENLDTLQTHAHQRLESDAACRLREAHLRTFRELTPKLKARIEAGRVVDGHGDFRLEHVYLDDDHQVTVLDALEFDPSFRIADSCADAAFFATELSVAGRSDLAETFLAAYTRENGDHGLYAIVDFYMTYWALVRAKVNEARARQLAGDESDFALEAANRYLFLAAHLAAGCSRGRVLVAVAGLIACGKSRVACALGANLAAPVLSSDRVRKQRASVQPTENLGSEALYEGAYSEAATQAVYEDLVGRAKGILRSGRPVVLDASFQRETARAALRDLAHSLGVPHLFVQCWAPRAEIQSRLKQREGRAHDSDARASLLPRFESQYPPWTDQDAEHHVRIDTTEDPAKVDERVLRRVRSLRRLKLSRPGISMGRRTQPPE